MYSRRDRHRRTYTERRFHVRHPRGPYGSQPFCNFLVVSRKSYEENSLTFPFRKSEQSFFEFRKSSRFHTFGHTCGHSTARGSSIANHPLVIIISSDPTIAHPWRPTRFPIFQLPRGEVLVHFHVGKKRAVYDSSCSRFFERVCEISATVTATATPPIDMSRGIIPVRVPVGDPSSWVGVGLISKGSSTFDWSSVRASPPNSPVIPEYHAPRPSGDVRDPLHNITIERRINMGILSHAGPGAWPPLRRGIIVGSDSCRLSSAFHPGPELSMKTRHSLETASVRLHIVGKRNERLDRSPFAPSFRRVVVCLRTAVKVLRQGSLDRPCPFVLPLGRHHPLRVGGRSRMRRHRCRG